MKKQFTIEKRYFLPLLASMQPLCSKKTIVDATSNILFNVGNKELIIKSTDLEISLQSSCTLESSTLIESESFLISGKRIYDLVKELEGSINFELKNNTLYMNAQGIDASFNIKDPQDFPYFPECIENLMHIESKKLLKILENVSFLIPQNNSNPAINGLYFEISPEKLTMTATDGHCLAQVSCPEYKLEKKQSWLMPRKTVFELKKLIENSNDTTIFLGTCENQIVFSGNLFNFFSKLLVHQFPEYHPILNKDSFASATIDRTMIIKTLRRTTCLLSGQFLATKFTFNKTALNVSIHNKEVGSLKEELSLKNFNANPIEIFFYTPYLLNGLQVFNEPTIECHLKNSSKPIIFESCDDEITITYLVMPVSPTHYSST